MAIDVQLAAGLVTGRAPGSNIGTDTLDSIERIRGSEFADRFDATGFSGTSTNAGSSGTFNRFEGQGGADEVIGNGNTSLDYFNTSAGITVTISGQGAGTVLAMYGSNTATDAFTGVFWINGGNSDDTFNGGTGADTFFGQGGNDFMNGAAGDDKLEGGAGADSLNGGAGEDQLTGGADLDSFIFDTPLDGSTNVDTIVDYVAADDLIHLNQTYFGGLGTGYLSASAFALDNATGSAAQIVYNTTTGALSYDSNGALAGGATQFAVLQGTPTLNANEFFIM